MRHPADEIGVLAHLVVEASVRCYDRVVLVNCQREVEAVVDGVGRCCAVAAVVVKSRAPRTEYLPCGAIMATMALMREMTAREAKNGFGRLLDSAQSAPVRVTRNGRAVGVMMSMRQFDALRGAAWERLTATMDALGQEASAMGLTDVDLESLLDEG